MSNSLKCRIIITGTFHIKEDHLESLQENGIEAKRIPFNPPTEEQLVKTVPGKIDTV